MDWEQYERAKTLKEQIHRNRNNVDFCVDINVSRMGMFDVPCRRVYKLFGSLDIYGVSENE